MRAAENILSRHQYSAQNTLTAGQLRLDATLGSFAEKAADPYSLAAVCLGGAAFRAVRGLGVSTLGGFVAESRAGAFLVNGVVNGGALVAEAGTFVSSERLLRVALGNADRSLLQWEGANGLKNAWTSSVVNFGALRGVGLATAGTNGIVQHAGAVTAMVTANHVSAALGITEAHAGSLMEEIVDASVLDIQMKVGMGLLHTMAPGLAHWEQSVDLAHEMRRASLGNAHEFSALSAHEEFLPSMGAEGSRGSKAERKAEAVRARLARNIEGFERDINTDHRILPSAKERIFEALGTEESRSAESLQRAKALRDDILSNTVPDSDKLAFAGYRHLLPNGISVLAGVCGVLSMFAAHEGHLKPAAWYLVAAAVLDKMDGGIARQKWFKVRRVDAEKFSIRNLRTYFRAENYERNPDGSFKKVDSRHSIGELLDSFVDAVCYGPCSGYFAYSVLSSLGIPESGVVAGVVISLNAILRLATFDFLGDKGKHLLPPRDVLHNPVYANGNGFIGRPSTMTAPELAAVWMATGNDHALLHQHPWLYAAAATLSGVAMYTPLAYDKLTDTGVGVLFRSKAFLLGTAGVIGASIYNGDPQALGIYSLAGMSYYLGSPFLKAGKRVWRNRNRNTPTPVEGGAPPQDGNTGGDERDRDSLTPPPPRE